MMIKFIKEKVYDALYMMNSFSKYAGILLTSIIPYVMLFIGLKMDFELKYWFVLLIPVVVLSFSSFLRWYANRVGKGDVCPIPSKRFTEVEEDGMVSVENSRLQEMILYVADVEDYLERKRYM